MSEQTQKAPKGIVHPEGEEGGRRLSEQTHKAPKGIMHPECENGRAHHDPAMSCEHVDGQLVWATIVNSQGLNADMFVRAKHTKAEWVFVFDREAELDDTPGAEGAF